MEFFEAVSSRQSIRAYHPTAVKNINLDKILTAANTAPSAGNLQAYQIVVVQHAVTRSSLAVAAHGQGFLAQAPVVLVFFADPARSSARYGARGENSSASRTRPSPPATRSLRRRRSVSVRAGSARSTIGASPRSSVRRHSCPPCVCWRSDMPQNAQRTSPRRDLSDLVHKETFKAA